MYQEVRSCIGDVQTLQDLQFWESLPKTETRELVTASRGIGLLYADFLISKYGLKICNPSECDILICSQFGERRKEILNSNPNLKLVLVLCYEPWSKIPDPLLEHANAKVVYLSSRFSSETSRETLLYVPLFLLYYGFSCLKPLSVPLSVEPRLVATLCVPFSQRKDCLTIISNTTASYRKSFVEKLMKHIKVDNYGKLFHNADSAISKSCWYDPRMRQLIGQYKCVLAMENESIAGYHSEKIMHGFLSQTVPIYWGDPLITKVFCPESFVEVLQGKEDVALRKIVRLCNDEEYWKRHVQAQVLQPYMYGKIMSQEMKLDKLLKNGSL